MKKLLILLILLFALPAYAKQCSEENPCPQVARLGVGLGSGVPSGVTCADCSGNIGLSAHFENNDDISAATNPCGCVKAGDHTWTVGASHSYDATYFKDGAYGLRLNSTGTDIVTLTLSNDDIVNSHEGTVKFWIRIDAWVSIARIVLIGYLGSTDYIRIRMAGGSDTDIEFDITTNTSGTGSGVAATSTLNGVEGTWYYVICKYHQGVSDIAAWVGVYSDEGGALLAQSTPLTTDASEMTSTMDLLTIGGSTGSNFVIDKLVISRVWE